MKKKRMIMFNFRKRRFLAFLFTITIFTIFGIILTKGANLPTVGGNTDTWGTILNAYLQLEHNANGSHTNITATEMNLTGDLIVNTSTFFVNTSADGVGIGTTAPSVALELGANKSLRITGGTSFPDSPSEGQMFFRTDNNQIYVYENSQWQADRKVATKIVTTSNSQNKERADYVADGTADDIEIQAAINSTINATGSQGGVVYLTEGVYNVTATLTLPSNITIIGAGYGTELKLSRTASYNLNGFENADATKGDTNIMISNLRINGNIADVQNSGLTSRCINFLGVNDSIITNNWLENCYRAGIWLATNSNGDKNNRIIITNNVFSDMGGGITENAVWGQGIAIESADSTLIQGNIFKDAAPASPTTGLAAINIEIVSAGSCDYNVIKDNQIIFSSLDADNNGIAIASGSSTNLCTGNIIEGNIIKNANFGIGLEDAPETKIVNNNIYITYRGGIDGTDADSSDLQIYNNRFYQICLWGGVCPGGQAAISVQGKAIITGNMIDMVSQYGTKSPGILVLNAPYSIVEANTVTDAGGDPGVGGIKIDGSNGTLVKGNSVYDNAQSGIVINNSDDVTVMGNFATNTAGGRSQTYGIEITADSVSRRTNIIGNSLQGNTDSAISDSGNNTKIAHNIGTTYDIFSNETSTTLSISQLSVGNILDLFDDAVKVFTILDGGNVGIGTVVPTSLLHLNISDGNVATVTDMLTLEHVNDSGEAADGIGSGILFRSIDDGMDVENISMIAGVMEDTSNASERGALVFYTGYGDENGLISNLSSSEVMRITGNGKVGIGTTAPTHNLNVEGSGNFTGGALGNTVPIILSANLTAIACDSSTAGGIIYSENRHYGCDGTNWNALY